MKHFTIFIVIVMLALSCETQVEKPIHINEQYNPTEEELFTACSELRGVGQYIIGVTTFSSVSKDKEYRAQNPYDYNRSNYYNGHWGHSFWARYGSSVNDEMEQSHYIEKEAGNIVKQMSNFGSFKIGELEFDCFDMAFLNDTLVAIWFFPKDEKKVVEHYIEKYGEGRGEKYYYERRTRNLKGEYSGTIKHDEKHIWENDAVALEYIHKEDFQSSPNKQTHFSSFHSMLIYSKSRYPIFEEVLKNTAKQFVDLKEKELNGTLESL